MSTFLELCGELHAETSDSGSFPATVVGVTGQHARTVRWARNAWREIQNRHANWLWLRSTFTFNTTASDDTYAYVDAAVTDSRLVAAITRFSRWWLIDDEGYPNIRSYLTSAGVSGEKYLGPLPWASFRDLYKKGSQTNNAPVHVSVDPQRNLVFGPKPDGIYTITGEYQMSAQVLSDDADTPEMPSDYHQLIVYYAMKKYAGNRAAPEAMARGVTEGNAIMRQLENNQRPQTVLGGPLV